MSDAPNFPAFIGHQRTQMSDNAQESTPSTRLSLLIQAYTDANLEHEMTLAALDGTANRAELVKALNRHTQAKRRMGQIRTLMHAAIRASRAERREREAKAD
jgi:hypothetical protein